MHSITVHNIDDPLYSLIKEKAQSKKTSINKTIKSLLEKALGVKHENEGTYAKNFEQFRGIWSVKEQKEFDRATSGFECIDEEDWR